MALFIILHIMLSIRSYILVLLLIFSLADTFLKTTEKSNYLSVYMHHNSFGSKSNFQIRLPLRAWDSPWVRLLLRLLLRLPLRLPLKLTWTPWDQNWGSLMNTNWHFGNSLATLWSTLETLRNTLYKQTFALSGLLLERKINILCTYLYTTGCPSILAPLD